MKLKKKVKVVLSLIVIIVLLIISYLIYKNFFSNNKVEEAKVISSIEDYGYHLKDNKNSTYSKMFYELKDILEKDKVDEEEYAKKIAEMFIYDFYSLDDKAAKNDIGGVDFIHQAALPNFLENAESTYYKYVESNIYGNRKQSLPMVDKVEIGELDNIEYSYEGGIDSKAYQVPVTWNYTKDTFASYQKSANVIIVHQDNKLCIVESK